MDSNPTLLNNAHVRARAHERNLRWTLLRNSQRCRQIFRKTTWTKSRWNCKDLQDGFFRFFQADFLPRFWCLTERHFYRPTEGDFSHRTPSRFFCRLERWNSQRFSAVCPTEFRWGGGQFFRVNFCTFSAPFSTAVSASIFTAFSR